MLDPSRLPPTAHHGRLDSLTSARFFAAFLVLCEHYLRFPLGHAGVSFFFVLSGFVLAYNYAGRLDRSGLRTFYLRRLARIYPTHVATALLVVPFAVRDLEADGRTGAFLIRALTNLTLTQSFVPFRSVYFGLNGVAWSISVEAFFYAVFPFLLVALASRTGRVRVRLLSAWLLGTCVVALFWTLVRQNAGMDDPLTHWLFYVNPLWRLLEFALGIGMGLAYREGGRGSGSQGSGTRQEVAMLCVVTATFATAFLLPAQAGPFLLSVWFVPAAIVTVHVLARSRGWLSRRLRAGWLLVLGESSFMLYMIHKPIQSYAIASQSAVLASAWLLIPVAVVASVLGHYLFERPAQRLVLRVASRHGATVVAGASRLRPSLSMGGPVRRWAAWRFPADGGPGR